MRDPCSTVNSFLTQFTDGHLIQFSFFIKHQRTTKVVWRRYTKGRMFSKEFHKEDGYEKQTNPKKTAAGIYKGTLGCLRGWEGCVTSHWENHEDIVRVFFLLESRRGKGTKLFTSLKHNPVGGKKKKLQSKCNNNSFRVISVARTTFSTSSSAASVWFLQVRVDGSLWNHMVTDRKAFVQSSTDMLCVSK